LTRRQGSSAQEDIVETQRPSLRETVLKSIVVHTVTYFLLGIVSFAFFDYSARFSDPVIAQYFRPTSDRIVTAGPLFQPIRGLILGALLFLLREPFFHRKRGWLLLWATLVVVGILSPYVGAPGSLEGLVYTRVPFSLQLALLPEVVLQTLLFSIVLFYWIGHPEKRWLSWVLAICFFLMLVFPALGLLVPEST
jgi:hypothetical protein